MIRVLSRYDYVGHKEVKPVIKFDQSNPRQRSRTLVSAAKECDINNIVARYEKTGLLGNPLDDISGRMPSFGDFSDLSDYHGLMCRMVNLQRQFMLVPAKVRKQFNNNVGELLAFVGDSKNWKEAVKLGLLDKSVLSTPSANGDPVPPAGSPPDDSVPASDGKVGT